MFTSKLSRVAHRATATTLAPANVSALSTAPCLASTAQRKPHHRRHSSSKVSGPPESGSKPAPAAKAPAEERRVQATEPQKENEKPAPRRLSRPKRSTERNPQKQKAATAESEAQDQTYAGLPVVPDVRHIVDKDIRMSSFFGLHRPLSVGTTIPPKATEDQFSRIFESKGETDAWKNGNSAQRKPEDVTYALEQTIKVLHGAAHAAEEEAVRWEVLQESSSNTNNRSVRHLDAPPKAARNIEELMNQFQPYNAPPPPQAFPEESAEQKRPSRKANQAKENKSKSFTTTITITEHPSSSGNPTYTASQSPLVQLPDPEATQQRPQPRKEQKPYLQRRRQRAYLSSRQELPRLPRTFFTPNPLRSARKASISGLRRPVQMRLISVKRQRKLKMKKHKYKKLMKRTRTLRRRLDRN